LNGRNATLGAMTRSTAFRGLAAAARLLLAIFAALPLAGAGLAAPGAETTLKANYLITIAGITIGRVDADSRFSPTGYATTISGSTYGISRFVSDAHAVLAGNGRINGTRVAPAAYNLETNEKGFETHVSMAMRGGSIVDLVAAPRLVAAPDRVPVTPVHKRNVVDPVGAFVVSVPHGGPNAGPAACDRTVKVFDGWQRYDVQLTYKESRTVEGSGPGSYSGQVFVCTARYIPVAGHRPARESVKFMADNKRLEVWLAPVAGTSVMVPYRIMIGTQVGDLVIIARDFAVSATRQAASAD
jgi:hypothetical protein